MGIKKVNILPYLQLLSNFSWHGLISKAMLLFLSDELYFLRFYFRESKGHWEEERTHIHRFIYQMLTTSRERLGLNPRAGNSIQVFHVGLEPSPWLPKIFFNRKLESGSKPWNEPRPNNMQHKFLDCYTKHIPLACFYKLKYMDLGACVCERKKEK